MWFFFSKKKSKKKKYILFFFEDAIKKKNHLEDFDKKKPKMQSNPEFVLYVSPKCDVSKALLALIQVIPTELNKIYIQDVTLLSQKPSWLNGTPILGETKTGVIHRGTYAITYVHKLVNIFLQEKPVIAEVKSNKLPPQKPQTALNDLFQIEDPPDDPKYQEQSRGISQQTLAELQSQRGTFEKVPNSM